MGCEIYDHDINMKNAFDLGSRGTIDSNDLKLIESHKSVIYLIYDQNGLENLHILHQFITDIITVCGYGIKFENSGVAHSKRNWLNKDFYNNTYDLLNSHTMLVSYENGYYSSGMHIFGLPDVSTEHSIDYDNATQLLTEFNHYQLFENPTFENPFGRYK